MSKEKIIPDEDEDDDDENYSTDFSNCLDVPFNPFSR